MLTRHKRRTHKDKADWADLKTAPARWQGVVRKADGITTVHAGRFFQQAKLLERLRGYRQMRLDEAWLCPIEQQVYYANYIELRRDEDISLPKHWLVRCCRRSAAIEAVGASG